MALFSISGSCIASNARLRLRSVNYVGGSTPAFTYSNSSGNYTFSNVPVGTYQIVADLNECSSVYLPTLYSYRNPQGVQVIANNISGLNVTPVLLSAANPSPNAF